MLSSLNRRLNNLKVKVLICFQQKFHGNWWDDCKMNMKIKRVKNNEYNSKEDQSWMICIIPTFIKLQF